MWTRLPFGENLREELGTPRKARKLASSPRSRVWRVDLADGPAVVKQVVDGDGADERYARELAALRVAARARQRLVHRLGVVAALAVDRADLRLLRALCMHLREAMLARWPKLRPLPTRRP